MEKENFIHVLASSFLMIGSPAFAQTDKPNILDMLAIPDNVVSISLLKLVISPNQRSWQGPRNQDDLNLCSEFGYVVSLASIFFPLIPCKEK